MELMAKIPPVHMFFCFFFKEIIDCMWTRLVCFPLLWEVISRGQECSSDTVIASASRGRGGEEKAEGTVLLHAAGDFCDS